MNSDGSASARQHLTCFVVDDRVAFDAGSLAMAVSDEQRVQIRDVVLTHAHLDHIAGLPLFLDDLFASLERPVNVYATREVVDVLERDVFNWSVYPRFSELENHNGRVLDYRIFEVGTPFRAGHLQIEPVEVNHKVPAAGFIVSDGNSTFALSGDTSAATKFWDVVNRADRIDAILIECAFPDELRELAERSHHLTPSGLAAELEKCSIGCPIYVINLKPMYREKIIEELRTLGLDSLEVVEPGRCYRW